MDFGDFEFSAVVSASVVALVLLSGLFSAGPLFALSLLALSQAGFFALSAFKKSGFQAPSAEYLFIAAVVVCFLASAVALGAPSAALSLLFVPIVFCAPAVGGLVRGAFSAG